MPGAAAAQALAAAGQCLVLHTQAGKIGQGCCVRCCRRFAMLHALLLATLLLYC
jgi:hypothetical protein